MKKVVAINAANNLSTGNIMMQIADISRENNYKYFTYSKYTKTSRAVMIDREQHHHRLIGNRVVNTFNRYVSWTTDFQDYGSYFTTKKLMRDIKRSKPDLIHLHDIVGWYINIDVLFKELIKMDIPVVWTMHCCWAYTGRCIYYKINKCDAWRNGCGKCPTLKEYPFSFWFDRSKFNYLRKKRLFTGIKNLTLVTPSLWITGEIKSSFLKDKELNLIYNGIDLEIFRPYTKDVRGKYNISKDKIMLLAVASAWEQPRKGLKYLVELEKLTRDRFQMVIVGVDDDIMTPDSFVRIKKTESQQELAELYSNADIFVNTTLDEVLGLVNLEALACGTPVVTFDSGGAPECIDEKSGIVVSSEKVDEMFDAITNISNNLNKYNIKVCRDRALQFSKQDKFLEYIKLYDRLIGG